MTIRDARLFAYAAHNAIGQVRKYTGEPYTAHLERVAQEVWDDGWLDDSPFIAFKAALLHDVIEDTKITYEDLLMFFGKEVADVVNDLTDVFTSTTAFGNRASRKAAECDRLSRVSPVAQTIKYADLIDNTKSVVDHDPNFAVVYLREKRNLLESMKDGSPSLREKAWRVLNDAERKLGMA